MQKNILYKKAVNLRRKGYSYEEIHSILKIGKSTAYGWLNNIELSNKAKLRLVKLQKDARSRGAKRIRDKLEKRDKLIKNAVNRSIKKIYFTKDLNKLLCSLLYWAEGEKTTKRIALTNSDPEFIKLFLSLFRGAFKIDDSKLRAVVHLHEYHNYDKQLKFWSKITNIPVRHMYIYKKPNSGSNIRPNYPGCISIRYSDIGIFREIENYYKLFSMMSKKNILMRV